jgi:hypothetical protein
MSAPEQNSRPAALRRFFPRGKEGGITHDDMLAMTDHESAAFAATASTGVVAVQVEDGGICFVARPGRAGLLHPRREVAIMATRQ